MTETSLKRQTFLPPWASRLPAASWVEGYTFLDESSLAGSIADIHDRLGGIRTIEVALAQAGEFWSCVAQVQGEKPGQSPLYTRFALLGFIQLWNTRQGKARIRDKIVSIGSLSTAVTQPIIFRHPALMPMEIALNTSTNMFERAMVYCATGLAA